MEIKAFRASERQRSPGGSQVAGRVSGVHWFLGVAACPVDAMKQPFINCEDKVDRLVGRRTKLSNGLSSATSTKASAVAWRKSLGGVRVPRGVHRFNTHEEADQWLWRMIAR